MPTPKYRALQIGEEDERKLGQWFFQEIAQTEGNREVLRRRWKDWEQQYESVPKEEVKTFPWDEASNMFVPITRIHTDLVFSRLHKSLFSAEDFWIVKPLNIQYEPHAKAMQQILNALAVTELALKETLKGPIKEFDRLGTTILKGFWKYTTRPSIFYRDDGVPERVENKVFYDGVAIEHVRLQDFYIPDPHLEIEQQRWVAQRLRFTWTGLNELVYTEFFTRSKIDEIYNYFMQNPQQFEVEEETLLKFNRVEAAIFFILEIWARIDINGDGLAEDLVIWMEEKSGTVLKVIYNPIAAGWRPYVAVRYVRRDGWFYGIGIPEMLRHVQAEINTIHNQRRDNATLANIRSVMIRDGAVMNLKPGDSLSPGNVYLVENPNEDIKPFQLGEVYPSSFEDERLSLQYAERVTGVTDPMVGRLGSGMGTRTPASLGMSIMQQSASRMELGIDDARDALTEMGYRIVELLQQFRPMDKVAKILAGDEEKIGLIGEILSLPVETMRQRFSLELGVVSQVLNRDVERQGLLTLNNYLTQLIQAYILPMAQLLANPQIDQKLKVAVLRITEIMDKNNVRLQELFDRKDVDSFAPILEEILSGQQIQGTGVGIGEGRGAGAVSPGVGGIEQSFREAGMELPTGGGGAGPS